MDETTAVVGSPVPRTDGLAKACGSAQFLDDLSIDGCWIGGTVRAQVPRGNYGKSGSIPLLTGAVSFW